MNKVITHGSKEKAFSAANAEGFELVLMNFLLTSQQQTPHFNTGLMSQRVNTKAIFTMHRILSNAKTLHPSKEIIVDVAHIDVVTPSRGHKHEQTFH